MGKRLVSRFAFTTAAILVTGIPVAWAQGAAGYVFTRIEIPGFTTDANGINNSGQIVGTAFGADGVQHAFVRDSDGTTTTFNVAGYIATRSTAINDLGQIVGTVYSGGPSGDSYVRASDGTFLIVSLGFLTEGWGINNLGMVSGTVEVVHNDHYDGFLRNGDGANSLISPPGAVNTWARGSNDAGQIVGGYQLGPNFASGQSFLRSSDGTFAFFNVPGAADSQAHDINNRGDIVGIFDYVYGGTFHGYLRSVDGSFTVIDYPGAIFTEARGINDAGQIVGIYHDGTTQHGFLATPAVPAKLWLGLKNSDAVGLRIDVRTEVWVDGALVGSGEVYNLPAGSSGFNNAFLRTVPMTLNGPLDLQSGSQVNFRPLVRRTCFGPGHKSGTIRLWFNGQPMDSGPGRDAGSRFEMTVDDVAGSQYLRTGFALSPSAGSAKEFLDAPVNGSVPCPARPFTSFGPSGTWSTTIP